MPTPKKSTAALALSGALDKHGDRNAHRGADMEPTGELRACPEFLNDTQRTCWAQVVASMPPGALKNADDFAVEALARLMAKVRSNEDTPAVYAQLGAYLDRFGMNPKARPNVQMPAKKNVNEFAAI